MVDDVRKKSLAGLFLLVIGCNAMSAKQTEFEWQATESAPKHYPMEITDGTFLYSGKDFGLYIPSGGVLAAGWGSSISNHVVGEKFKPLPDRLNITFFSWAEKQFYHGKFDLPYERILELFREGVVEDKENPLYRSIMVGIAPGGSVAVWLKGRERVVEVFFGQAEKVEKRYVGRGLIFDDETHYQSCLNKILSDSISPSELDSLRKNGIPLDLWSRYRNRYLWKPIFTVDGVPADLNVRFLNGESEKTFSVEERVADYYHGPLPKEISFDAVVNGKERYYIVSFDEFEIMEAFEKLGTNGEKVFIEFDPSVPRAATKVRIYNDAEFIELKKATTKD